MVIRLGLTLFVEPGYLAVWNCEAAIPSVCFGECNRGKIPETTTRDHCWNNIYTSTFRWTVLLFFFWILTTVAHASRNKVPMQLSTFLIAHFFHHVYLTSNCLKGDKQVFGPSCNAFWNENFAYLSWLLWDFKNKEIVKVLSEFWNLNFFTLKTKKHQIHLIKYSETVSGKNLQKTSQNF